LSLLAPQAVPNGTVKALIKVTSYLGADVSDAAINVTWTVPLAKGSFNVTTDARVRVATGFGGGPRAMEASRGSR
jgi:hypothetical protein